MRPQLTQVAASIAVLVVVVAVALHVVPGAQAVAADDSSEEELPPLEDQCEHTLTRSKGFSHRFQRLKNIVKHSNPFAHKERAKIYFYLYKREFPNCGRELVAHDDAKLQASGFDARHPTRIIIHGWMSHGKGTLSRDVKQAYLNLTEPNTSTASSTASPESRHYSDFNIIICDWSKIAANVNYFGVADLVEDLGFLLAELVRHLHKSAGLRYDDVYVIGHSLGAQIAGSAGKQLRPERFNTIFALDPAGPKFREQSDEFRLDASDASYVESIQTSVSLGFEEPVGHATFYPNFGRSQKKCYIYGCSHRRSHDYFAESITSSKGFWGTRCERKSENEWILLYTEEEHLMGGEPSIPKNGTFYVKTHSKRPYAMGRWQRKSDESWMMDTATEAD